MESGQPADHWFDDMHETTLTAIRKVLADHARLATPVDQLSDGDDLYAAGMTSHSSVNVMLALEDAFDVEFPDSMLRRSVFESVASIAEALAVLDAQPAAA